MESARRDWRATSRLCVCHETSLITSENTSILSFSNCGYPLLRVSSRISPCRQWLHDNIKVSRVARRCSAIERGNHWWPRRKHPLSLDHVLICNIGNVVLKRRYAAQVAERIEERPDYYPANDYEIIETLAGRLKNYKEREFRMELPRAQVFDLEVAGRPIELPLKRSWIPTDPVVQDIPQRPDRGVENMERETYVRESLETHAIPDESVDEPSKKQEVSLVARSTQPAVSVAEDVTIGVEQEQMSRTIYILGSGPVGTFIAHTLASINHAPPVTLLLHRPLLIQQWHDEGAATRLLKNGEVNVQASLNVELSTGLHKDIQTSRPKLGKVVKSQMDSSDGIIDHLIVTTKGFATVSALSEIRHRLRPSSTICFIQDGLGSSEDVTRTLFPSLTDRPSYMLGSISHRLYPTNQKFTVAETQPGSVSLTVVPRYNKHGKPNEETILHGPPSLRRGGMMGDDWTPGAKYLLRTLSRTPEFAAQSLNTAEYFKARFDRLAISAVIGPLSVLFDCSNDKLLYNYQISRAMKLLLAEVSQVLQSLPEVSRIPQIDDHFAPQRLERIVVSVIGQTGKNLSSMLQAVKAGERTDIEYYNGYILRRAAQLRIDCPHNEMLVNLVRAKQTIKNREMKSYIPFGDD